MNVTLPQSNPPEPLGASPPASRHPAATGERVTAKRQPKPPAPKVSIQAIEKLLLRQVNAPSTGPLPEQRLVVAVICHTLVDALYGDTWQQRSANRFLTGPELSFWASLVDLNPQFVCEVATRCGYLLDDAGGPLPSPPIHPPTHMSKEAPCSISMT